MKGEKYMNKVILIGRLTRDPEVSYSNAGNAVARYTLAVDRLYKRDNTDQTADFIRCVAFNKTAEFAESYLYKGIKIAVTGHIQTGSYTGREGQTVYTTDVVVKSQEFCESKSASNQTASDSSFSDRFMNIPDGIDEELPFN